MRSSVVVFALISTALLGLFYTYMARRLFLFGWPQPRLLGYVALAVPFLLAMALPLLFVLRSRNPTHAPPEYLFVLVFLSLSFLSGLLTLVVIRDLLLFPAMATARWAPTLTWFTPSTLESVMVSRLIPTLALVFTAWGFIEAHRTPCIRTVEVAVAGLPASFDGYKVALISDIHIGPTIGRRFLGRMKDAVNSVEPDLVVLPGDLADGLPEALRDRTNALAEIQAKDGRFYATGNHEYYWDAPGWIAEMRRLGWTPLINAHRVIQHPDGVLVVAGVTDPTAFRMTPADAPNFRKALLGAPKGAPVLWLGHQPAAAFEAAPLGPGLMVSGHTHGGQCFPWNLLIHLFHPFVRGLYPVTEDGRFSIYVSPGTGYWGPPNRLGVRSEITLLVLRKP